MFFLAPYHHRSCAGRELGMLSEHAELDESPVCHRVFLAQRAQAHVDHGLEGRDTSSAFTSRLEGLEPSDLAAQRIQDHSPRGGPRAGCGELEGFGQEPKRVRHGQRFFALLGSNGPSQPPLQHLERLLPRHRWDLDDLRLELVSEVCTPGGDHGAAAGSTH